MTTPKVKIKLAPYELLTLSGMIQQLMRNPVPADNSDRCALATLMLWHRKKILPSLDYPQPAGNTLSLDAPLAFAFLSAFEGIEARPGEALDTKLLSLFDSIHKTFISPISQTPAPYENPNRCRI